MPTKICPHCHKPMKLWSKNFGRNGETTSTQFACFCRGSVYYENEHVHKADVMDSIQKAISDSLRHRA